MNSLPTLFVSHGAPTLAIDPGATGERLRSLALGLQRPRAILVISAHWDTVAPRVSTAAPQSLIYDFTGFPAALYKITYPTPGAPDLARKVKALLAEAGVSAELDPARGLDHGAWVPLLFLYPEASIPVTQLSVLSGLGPAHHYRVGRAISALRAQGVLIIGSGSFTHNLHEVGRHAPDAPPLPYIDEFRAWMKAELAAGNLEGVLEYRDYAPPAARVHPTEEHLLPLFTALGAAGWQAPVQHIHEATTYGVLAMDIFMFGDNPAAASYDRGEASSSGRARGAAICRK